MKKQDQLDKLMFRIFAVFWIATTVFYYFPSYANHTIYLICCVSSLITIFFLSIHSDFTKPEVAGSKTLFKVHYDPDPDKIAKLAKKLKERLTGYKFLFAIILGFMFAMDMVWYSWSSIYSCIFEVRPIHTLAQLFGTPIIGIAAFFTTFIVGQVFRKTLMKKDNPIWLTFYSK